MRLTERAQFLIDNLNLPEATGVDGARWERFQIAHLCDDGPLRIERKSRQIAWSWVTAAEAVASAILAGESTAFVSINLDEAAEKLRYARRVYESLRLSGLPKIATDNVLELSFDNGARILSHPSRPPRGKARLNVVLDEFAHVQHDRDIYTGSLPILSKGGRLRIGSSPCGASGTFWEVDRQEMRQYPGYTRVTTPWWECHSFCNNVKAALASAPSMNTADRVGAFGSERIKALHSNMVEDDFRQEFECEYVNEAEAWIPWDAIKRGQAAFGDSAWHKATDIGQVQSLIERTLADIQSGRIEPVLFGGLDIGRTRDLTEFVAVGKSSASASTPLRIMISLAGVPFDDQQAAIEQVITRLPFIDVLIDRNGIGMNLAENLERTGRAHGVNFTNENKSLWAVQARLMAERVAAPIPSDRDLAYQIHSVRKRISAAHNPVFDSDRAEKHHADKFWAWALALWAAGGCGPTTASQITRYFADYKPAGVE